MSLVSRLQLLGLIVVGNLVVADSAWANPACGDTLDVDTTLTADLDCTALTAGPALTLGTDNITLGGAGFAVIAPLVVAVKGVDLSGVTITNLKITTSTNDSDGVDVYGTNLEVTKVNVTGRQNGLRLAGAGLSVGDCSSEFNLRGL
ncbi:MAG: hypothetical protein ACI9MR_001370 [Myxococcota bacterium]|jgi:hypothetical protein